MMKKYKFNNIILLIYLGLYIPYVLGIVASLIFGYALKLEEIVNGIIFFNLPYLLPSGWPNTIYMKSAFGILQACTIFSYLYISINPDAKKIWAYIGIPAIIIYFVLFNFTNFFVYAKWG